MWTMVRAILFWLCFGALVSCSVTVQNVGPNYALDANTNRGIAVFSLSYSGDNFAIRYWSLEGDSRGEIAAHSRSAPLDWPDPPTKLVFIELPAGKYEFYEGIDFSGVTSERTAPFSIPFEVVAGKALYLGNIDYDRTRRTAKQKISISDRSERDISLLLKKLPKLTKEQVDVNIASITEPTGRR